MLIPNEYILTDYYYYIKKKLFSILIHFKGGKFSFFSFRFHNHSDILILCSKTFLIVTKVENSHVA